MAQATTEHAPVTVGSTVIGAHDVCDSCGAAAYVRVTLAHGELFFCGHHAAKYRESLGDKVIEWHDETDRLHHELGQ